VAGSFLVFFDLELTKSLVESSVSDFRLFWESWGLDAPVRLLVAEVARQVAA
jgi:hypothetical protein